ncbi:MAG TPA: dihydrolipoamide acetyltransferase family protein [Gemmatimonadales bacterium]|nr:dihydrolipoamide acetyltransferase family protein [Gemmatimonadales bacterium]
MTERRLEEFRMPSLGADMAAGRLVQWLKAPGDRLARGDVVAEVDTDKGVIAVEVFTEGVLAKILVEPDEKVPVGTPLALIERGEGAPAEPVVPPPPAGAPAVRERVRVSPLARRLAAELGVDLATVPGTGPGGAITREDVEAAARARPARPAPTEPAEERHARMRQAIAAAMARSKREIPHYYLSTRIDLGRAMEWLAGRNRDRPPAERLLAGALQLKAVALALREFPDLNAWWVDGRAVAQPGIHPGVAVSLRGGGLVVPAVHDADRLGLDALMRAMHDLVARARAGALRSSELSDGTITVTSLGERGVDAVFGIIYPPQVAIVGFGRVVERPAVVDGAVVARPVVTATLSGDHRASDGHRGGLFLARVEQLLQEPERL